MVCISCSSHMKTLSTLSKGTMQDRQKEEMFKLTATKFNNAYNVAKTNPTEFESQLQWYEASKECISTIKSIGAHAATYRYKIDVEKDEFETAKGNVTLSEAQNICSGYLNTLAKTDVEGCIAGSAEIRSNMVAGQWQSPFIHYVGSIPSKVSPGAMAQGPSSCKNIPKKDRLPASFNKVKAQMKEACGPNGYVYIPSYIKQDWSVTMKTRVDGVKSKQFRCGVYKKGRLFKIPKH